ncbi:MAG: transketolase [Myxococcota bacterium]
MPWSPALRRAAADTIRTLAIDATNQARSGHPGAPMGLADLAVVLFGEVLRFDPQDPAWPNRDRFVLSNGHASMLQYAALHLTGYTVTLEDLQRFRQLGSKTAGHPERGVCPGIETTTGPLGQGFANAVGMALAAQMARARLPEPDLLDHQVFVVLGDGCMMEGITQEAASLAGHLGLGGLVAIYDDNGVTIDGRTDIAFSEDVATRFRALGWRVETVDGHDQAALGDALRATREVTDRPTLLVAKTHIGYGSPNRQDTSKAHGEPLGEDEAKATKKKLGWNHEAFFVPSEVREAFLASARDGAQRRTEWRARLDSALENDAFRAAWNGVFEPPSVPGYADLVAKFSDKVDATRSLSGAVLNALADGMPQLVGGSADLAGSNKSAIKSSSFAGPKSFGARNVHFGIREHAMGGICNGIATYGCFRPYGATFLAFSDYMRPALRLAALMKLRTITVFTHDSIGLGEDGPTHQPVEHLWALRVIPGLEVWRPANGVETLMAWIYATTQGEDRPHALVFTRQKLPSVPAPPEPEAVWKGGYVLQDADGEPEAVLVATGSEVPIALEASRRVSRRLRVVSMPCLERFLAQPKAYQDEVIPNHIPVATLEAGRTDPWAVIAGRAGLRMGLDQFGESAPYDALYAHFKLDPGSVAARLSAWLASDAS